MTTSANGAEEEPLLTGLATDEDHIVTPRDRIAERLAAQLTNPTRHHVGGQRDN